MIYDFQRLLSRRLLVWSLLSILVGAYFVITGDTFWRAFGIQAAAWGAIDALIALFGLRGLAAQLSQTVDLEKANARARWLRRILWINTGLDVLYISGGLALAFTLGTNDPSWRGTGWGVVVQGGFLLLFDLLHALSTPREGLLPDLGLFDAHEHQSFLLPGSGDWTAVLVHGFPGTPGEMRDLARDLHAQGWSVEGLLLPGFGREYPRMFLQRATGWIEAIAQSVRRHQQAGQKVMLVGFSMGGGLSACAAALVSPQKLALLSPFWFDESPATRALLWFMRLFFPASLRPFGLPLSEKMLQAGATKSAPEIDLGRPEIQSAMRDLRVPIVFLEQFREIGFRIRRAYPLPAGAKIPTLVTRGERDPLVQRRVTRRLAELTRARLVELPGEHHIYVSSDPAYPEALNVIFEFAGDGCGHPLN